MIRKELRCAVVSFFLISLGGFFLQLRFLPPMNLVPFEIEISDLLPAAGGIISVFVLPFMFNCKKTFLLAVMLNLLIVSLSTVSMVYYSATHWDAAIPVTIANLILHTTLADILILFARIPIGHSILGYWENRS